MCFRVCLWWLWFRLLFGSCAYCFRVSSGVVLWLIVLIALLELRLLVVDVAWQFICVLVLMFVLCDGLMWLVVYWLVVCSC